MTSDVIHQDVWHPHQKQRTPVASEEKTLTAEVWRPPLIDDRSSSLASISVGLELVTQHFLIAIEPTHVEHTISEERNGVYNALPGKKKKRRMLKHTGKKEILTQDA